MIHKFEQDLLKTLEKNRDKDVIREAEKTFNQNIITLSLFTMVYRMAHEDTAGIDDQFKKGNEKIKYGF